MKLESHSVVSNSLWLHGLYNPWNSPGQNTGVGSLSLLQGIFPTQGSNPGLPHRRQILYHPSHQGSWLKGWMWKVKVTQLCPTLCNSMDYTIHGILQARKLGWVAFPLSRWSSQSRNQTQVSTMQADSLPAEPLEKPKNTGVFFSSGSSWPRNWTRVSCIAGGFFYQLSYQRSLSI